MRTCYAYHCSPTAIAVVDLCQGVDLPGWLITRVNVPVPFRRRGIATRLMREVLEDADYEETVLLLTIYPYGDMTFEQLAEWYGRLGFQWSPNQACMIRVPGGGSA